MNSRICRQCLILIAFCLLTAVNTISAVKLTVFNKSDIAIFSCSVEDLPTLSFSDMGLKINSSTMQTLLPMTSYETIGRIDFRDSVEPDAIINISGNGTSSVLNFQYTDGRTVIIDGLESKSSVSIYSVDGKAVKSNLTRNGNRVVIDLGNMPQGYYLINTDNQTFKIFKK